jgi:hypothetical protein
MAALAGNIDPLRMGDACLCGGFTAQLFDAELHPVGKIKRRGMSGACASFVGAGNLYVRWPLCKFAHAASHTTSVFKSKFQALIIRRGHKRSIVALAHKLLRTMFFMLQRGEYSRDTATDYDAGVKMRCRVVRQHHFRR